MQQDKHCGLAAHGEQHCAGDKNTDPSKGKLASAAAAAAASPPTALCWHCCGNTTASSPVAAPRCSAHRRDANAAREREEIDIDRSISGKKDARI